MKIKFDLRTYILAATAIAFLLIAIYASVEPTMLAYQYDKLGDWFTGYWLVALGGFIIFIIAIAIKQYRDKKKRKQR